jgi:UDP-N-acetylmuramate dehydrogenase
VTDDSVLRALAESRLRRFGAGEPMSRHTSWRIGGPADYFCVVEEFSQLQAAVRVARDHDLPWLVLGGGNNILVSDAGVEGLVILNRLRGLALAAYDSGAALVCGAGVFFARAAQYSAQHGYTGMEWGIAVPGTVGGGVVGNAGAHWSDVSRSLLSADVADAAGRVERLAPDDLAYRYRQSALKTPHTTQTRLVVVSCQFAVQPERPEAALARLEELRQHRLRTQPVKEASAGSTFKNPPDSFAGALIEAVGLKGRIEGRARISPLHANFILNLGGATAADVVALMGLARQRVWVRFGVLLEPEVQLVGRWSQDVLHSLLGAAA